MEENLKQISLKDGLSHKIRIVVIGNRSASETLVNKLAGHFEGRSILSSHDRPITVKNIIAIAEQHINTENSLLTESDFLFTDTCVLSINAQAEAEFGIFNPIVAKAARKNKYDLFIVCNDEHPSENIISILEKLDKPFITLGGVSDLDSSAIAIIDELKKAKTLGFNSCDFLQAYKHGISFDDIRDQLQFFKKGIHKINLDRPASADDGILKLGDAEVQRYAKIFTNGKNAIVCQKFVPASGAASRMFKFLTEFLTDFNLIDESINSYINRKSATQLSVFLAGMEKFPFFETVNSLVREKYPDFDSWPRNKKNYSFIEAMLQDEQLNYGNMPKGVLPFHKYASHLMTPIEEHILEALHYACSETDARLHFTVTKEHQHLFEQIIENVRTSVDAESGITINVDYSYQDPSTDTIAVDTRNVPFRDDNDQLVFRPGGHGALLTNLNNLNADVIFIKNIDNVVQDDIETIALYKKVLGGLLIDLQQTVFIILEKIDDGSLNDSDVNDIVLFMRDRLNIQIAADFQKYTLANQLDFIATALNRPIRVCGMVKNEGEPGGGPFWVRSYQGTSLQIVETSQVDLQNPEQRKIIEKAGYFNPVDIVCGIRDYRGKKFDLNEYIDPDTGFIVAKNKGGRDLKAYELPGLWNGSMAYWITVFVEVPLQTFNPVKTVNDLLKPAHQPS